MTKKTPTSYTHKMFAALGVIDSEVDGEGDARGPAVLLEDRHQLGQW